MSHLPGRCNTIGCSHCGGPLLADRADARLAERFRALDRDLLERTAADLYRKCDELERAAADLLRERNRAEAASKQHFTQAMENGQRAARAGQQGQTPAGYIVLPLKEKIPLNSWQHPELQALLSSRARNEIELSIAMDMLKGDSEARWFSGGDYDTNFLELLDLVLDLIPDATPPPAGAPPDAAGEALADGYFIASEELLRDSLSAFERLGHADAAICVRLRRCLEQRS